MFLHSHRRSIILSGSMIGRYDFFLRPNRRSIILSGSMIGRYAWLCMSIDNAATT